MSLSKNLETEASVEGAVLTRAGPRFTHRVTRIEGLGSVAHLPVIQTYEWCVPNQVRHLAAEIIRHCFDIDSGIVCVGLEGATFVHETDRR